jgi:hypothetical protein
MTNEDYQGAAHAIMTIPDEHRLTMFRGRSPSYIASALNDYHDFIIDRMAYHHDCDPGLITIIDASDDNHDGADLVGSSPSGITDIELKFGKETNSNIGMATAGTIIPDVVSMLDDRYGRLPRKARAESIINGTLTLDEVQHDNIEFFHDIMDHCVNGGLTPRELASLLSLVSGSGNDAHRNHDRDYLKLVFLDGGIMRDETTVYDDTSMNRRIEVTKNRLNIIITGQRHIVRMVFNNKNNLHYDGGKIPARYYVGSPSFNVFVKSV